MEFLSLANNLSYDSARIEGLYWSHNPWDIVSLYESITTDELISWMKSRPSGKAQIFETEGDSDIVVVIPTADHAGKYASVCRNIFKGVKVIFVESGHGDPYFNYARNSNYGLRYALDTYRPKWIVLSNDDMFKLDKQVFSLRNSQYLTRKRQAWFSQFLPARLSLTHTVSDWGDNKQFHGYLLDSPS